MKHLLLVLLLIFSSVATVSAGSQPEIIFSQNVIAMNADGSMVPSVKIDPHVMSNMQTYNFDLDRGRILRIHTNIENAEERGLTDVVTTVKRCYSYIETMTGRQLERGVMLYLVEFDKIPYAYNFSATYNDTTQWGEVRLALIERDKPLSGRHAAASISDLLYDTLPHELGHDVLEGIPQLLHDIDGEVSQHTRWFVEGICEVLAKGFSKREVPMLHHRYLSLRNINNVLEEEQMRDDLLSWSQNNGNSLASESALYGAAMLTMMAWLDDTSLSELLDHLANQNGFVSGSDLTAVMWQTAGLNPQEMFNRGHAHGMRLNEKVLLTRLELE